VAICFKAEENYEKIHHFSRSSGGGGHLVDGQCSRRARSIVRCGYRAGVPVRFF
jgi:hypothetical protein